MSALLPALRCMLRGSCSRGPRTRAFSVSAASSTPAAASSASSASASSSSAWPQPGIAVDFVGVPQATVADVLVNVTFVNYAGERTSLPGRVGDTLFDVAKRYKYRFVDGACGGGGSARDLLHKEGGWYEPKYGEGAQCYFCHVIIPKSHYAGLPPKRPDELFQLRKYPFAEDMTDTSRLACQVRLSKENDGMLVYCPDGPPSLDV